MFSPTGDTPPAICSVFPVLCGRAMRKSLLADWLALIGRRSLRRGVGWDNPQLGQQAELIVEIKTLNDFAVCNPVDVDA